MGHKMGRREGAGPEHWQPLESHLRGVAELAARFAAAFGAEDWGRLAGLWHDAGKAARAFQEYLCSGKAPPGPDHKLAGALAATRAGADVLAFVLAGHHGGLCDPAHVKEQLAAVAADPVRCSIAQQCATPDPRPSLPEFAQSPRSAEFFIRMLFSALTDADYLDTEAFVEPNKAEARSPQRIELEELWEAMERAQASMPAAGLVNRARRAVYRAALSAADKEPGFFSLTVPTGGGKTLTAMAFALRHALAHGLRRVIVVIPYTSIIEQNANVYRGIFGEAAVVEHHSSVDPDRETEFSRLAAENWDAPIVVTTSVQFFESLHAHRPGRCRKLHNVARSVVILDEVQTFPVELVEPTLELMHELAAHYGTSFVLSTATQPALRRRDGFAGLPDVREIVPDARALFQALRRVDYEWRTGPDQECTWAELAEELARQRQVLCVVNTKADALAVYRLLPPEGRFHLSSAMCSAHRTEVLDAIRERLCRRRPCRVVSTQLIEAGVDVDFPAVYRAFGPLDSIVQAAGRCNREGRLELGRVVVFRPRDGGMPPGPYRRATQQTEALARRLSDEALHDPALFDEYYSLLYQVSDLDEAGILGKRERLNFPAVSEAYRLITAPTVPVLVPHGEGRGLQVKVGAQTMLNRRLWRRLQRFTVSLYQHALRRAQQMGLCREAKEGLWIWEGPYDADVGIRMQGYRADETVC